MTRWHLELGPELPGSAPVPQGTSGGESTSTTPGAGVSYSRWTTNPRMQCSARRPVTAEHALLEFPTAGGIGSRQPGHGKGAVVGTGGSGALFGLGSGLGQAGRSLRFRVGERAGGTSGVGYDLVFPGFLCAQVTCVNSDAKTQLSTHRASSPSGAFEGFKAIISFSIFRISI